MAVQRARNQIINKVQKCWSRDLCKMHTRNLTGHKNHSAARFQYSSINKNKHQCAYDYLIINSFLSIPKINLYRTHWRFDRMLQK